MIGIETSREKSQERFQSPRELARLGNVLTLAEQDGTESNWALAVIGLRMLTSCRRNEILNLRCKDVNIEQAMALRPDTKTEFRPVHLSTVAPEHPGFIAIDCRPCLQLPAP